MNSEAKTKHPSPFSLISRIKGHAFCVLQQVRGRHGQLLSLDASGLWNHSLKSAGQKPRHKGESGVNQFLLSSRGDTQARHQGGQAPSSIPGLQCLGAGVSEGNNREEGYTGRNSIRSVSSSVLATFGAKLAECDLALKGNIPLHAC